MIWDIHRGSKCRDIRTSCTITCEHFEYKHKRLHDRGSEVSPLNIRERRAIKQTCHIIRVTRIRYEFWRFLKLIQPYTILLLILAKSFEKLLLTTLCPCMRHKTL